jgi:hypothetical protein
MVRIARETGDIDLRDAAVEFGRSMKSGADELAKDLAAFATELATSRDLATSRR